MRDQLRVHCSGADPLDVRDVEVIPSWEHVRGAGLLLLLHPFILLLVQGLAEESHQHSLNLTNTEVKPSRENYNCTSS